MPLDRFISQLVDSGKGQSFDRSVAEVACESRETRRRVATNARLRAGVVESRRRRQETGDSDELDSIHSAVSEVDRAKGKRRAISLRETSDGGGRYGRDRTADAQAGGAVEANAPHQPVNTSVAVAAPRR